MSVSYQGETFDISEKDLIQINSELGNLSDELYICDSSNSADEEYLEKLLERWEEPGTVPGIHFTDEELELLYKNNFKLTPQEEQEWLEYENSRLESDLLESENEWL